MFDVPKLLESLCHISFEAGEIAQHEREHLEREQKPDGSIVTSADRKVEIYLREALTQLVPGSTVWGEEFGYARDEGHGVWLVDPVDGTTNFAFGSPLWGVSICLAHENELQLGAVFLPDLNELYLAAKGQGAFLNGEPLAPIPPAPFEPYEICGYCESVSKRIPRASIPGRMRCTGAFVVEGAFVATQRYRGMIGIRERLYDVAACVLLNQELGADIRYADGRPLDIAAMLEPVKFETPWIIFPAGTEFLVPEEA